MISLCKPLRLAACMAVLAVFPLPSAEAQEATPGTTCAGFTAGTFRHSTGPEVAGYGHMLVCDGTTWINVLSYTDAGDLTQLGNQSCNSGDVLQFSSATWQCTAGSGFSSDLWTASTGDAIYYHSGTPLVGIGTTDPESSFNVVGRTILEGSRTSSVNTSNGSGFVLGFKETDSGKYAGFSFLDPPGGGPPHLKLETASGGRITLSGFNILLTTGGGTAVYDHSGFWVMPSPGGLQGNGSSLRTKNANRDVLTWGMNEGVTITPYDDTKHSLRVRGYSATQAGNLQEWQTSSGTDLAVVDAAGNFGLGTSSPQSALHVSDGKYLQAEDHNAGAPSATDCDDDAERGRISLDTANNRLYVCMGASRGWDYTALTD